MTQCRICKEDITEGIVVDEMHLDCRQKALRDLEASNKKYMADNNIT